ncbi:hypothetical protein B0T16DRAFT_179925 [Cercophora newfieldiana]|uniref:Uncharacterized protein n=1 Tax=Cercophora newfieldiana TaxID=92897 RepID=A0AA40CLZ3_9PEZI|nr:hypothetical protein B0T16DRAFT_179925 [Cercophora newfieldiana]
MDLGRRYLRAGEAGKPDDCQNLMRVAPEGRQDCETARLRRPGTGTRTRGRGSELTQGLQLVFQSAAEHHPSSCTWLAWVSRFKEGAVLRQANPSRGFAWLRSWWVHPTTTTTTTATTTTLRHCDATTATTATFHRHCGQRCLITHKYSTNEFDPGGGKPRQRCNNGQLPYQTRPEGGAPRLGASFPDIDSTSRSLTMTSIHIALRS